MVKIVIVQDLNKGEAKGHPFRGNQYSEGANTAAKEAARLNTEHEKKYGKPFGRGSNAAVSRDAAIASQEAHGATKKGSSDAIAMHYRAASFHQIAAEQIKSSHGSMEAVAKHEEAYRLHVKAMNARSSKT